MAVQIAGLSTLGVKFGYAVEQNPGEKPTVFKWLERCNQIGGIALTVEQIDASALEDLTTRNIAGRQDSGGEWSVTFNDTPEVQTQLNAMIAAYNEGKAANKKTWFEVWAPNMTDAYFVVAEPPQVLPLPEHGQNELKTIELTFSIDQYKGTDTAIEPAN